MTLCGTICVCRGANRDEPGDCRVGLVTFGEYVRRLVGRRAIGRLRKYCAL